MKKFDNKVSADILSRSAEGETKHFRYSDYALVAINSRPADKGFTFEEMKKRLKLVELFGEAKDEVELEDAEAEALKSCVEQMNGNWGMFTKDLVAFIESVKAL